MRRASDELPGKDKGDGLQQTGELDRRSSVAVGNVPARLPANLHTDRGERRVSVSRPQAWRLNLEAPTPMLQRRASGAKAARAQWIWWIRRMSVVPPGLAEALLVAAALVLVQVVCREPVAATPG